MFRAQRLDILCHNRTVFERVFGFVGVPVGNEKRTRPYWQYTHEANRFFNFKSAAKDLENSLHHCVSLIRCCQAR